MGFSRRDFIKILPYGTGALMGLDAYTAYLHKDNLVNYIRTIVSKNRLTDEESTKLSEIEKYRESLGLSGLPKEINEPFENPINWESDPPPFTETLPQKNKSIGMRTYEILATVFGKNMTRNIFGVKSDPHYPNNTFFDANDQFYNIPISAHNTPLLQHTDYILHEALGHSSDPTYFAKYPPEILIKVLHGKWKALSQCLSIPGQFLNNPGDLMYPLLKKQVGETVGKFMVGINNSSIVDFSSIPTLQDKIIKIAHKMGKDPKTLKYNKLICKMIGEEVIKMQNNNQIEFTGDLKETYQTSMEGACVEIYAEMVKYALFHPDLINNNQEVTNGIKEIILAINPDANFDDITHILTMPSPKVVDRYNTETISLKKAQQELGQQSVEPDYPVPDENYLTLEPKEETQLKVEEAIVVDAEKIFNDYVENGRIPKTLLITNNDDRETLSKFTAYYSTTVKKYSMLRNTFAQYLNKSFDPNMHIWDIRDIEYAVDSGFVKGLLNLTNLSKQVSDELKRKTKYLERFVNSPDF